MGRGIEYDELSGARLDALLREVVRQAMADWDAATEEQRVAALQAAAQLQAMADRS